MGDATGAGGASQRGFKNSNDGAPFSVDSVNTPCYIISMRKKNTSTAECLVAFQGFGGRNEFRVKSPTGRIVTLRCNGLWDAMSLGLRLFIADYQADVDRWSSRPTRSETLTFVMMAEIARLGRISGVGEVYEAEMAKVNARLVRQSLDWANDNTLCRG